MQTLRELQEELVLMAHRVGSQKDLAAQLGLLPQELSFILSGKRRPNQRILDKLGYDAVTMYRKKPR